VAHGLHKEMGVGVLICLEQGADLHMAQLMPLRSLSFASVKSRQIFPLCYWLTRVVPDKGLLDVCVSVCVRVRAYRRLVHSKMSPQGSLSLYIVPCDVLALFAGICQL